MGYNPPRRYLYAAVFTVFSKYFQLLLSNYWYLGVQRFSTLKYLYIYLIFQKFLQKPRQLINKLLDTSI